MRRGARIVTLLVLSLLMQAVAPGAFASCMGSEHSVVMQPQTDHPCADEPVVKKTHDCCGSDAALVDCSGSDCTRGGSQSMTLPVSFPDGLVITHDQQSVVLVAFMPAAPPAFRFRPPIA